MKSLISYIKYILIAFAIALIVRNFVFNISIVNQTSMYPTLKPKDVLISNSFYRFSKNHNRGDIIVFKSSEDNKLLIKRIIGLPGETVEILDGDVLINGDLLEENYLEDPYTPSEIEKFEVGEDELFVMGDNRDGSFDSRNFGPIKNSSVRSKPIVRILPIKNAKFINKK
ncbi:signal peptidase I [Peptoniphilus sp. MSJ-1]|uniref:Signal peptidase I n=1 Tax=Peptoniphilus ovalis TaxID=2841503 RepID=A0ABS6FH52_9FIRM|nr:signal peptidase I [Peptoniphilus ovalis]MBU5668852.1 signal peptidase I [Peptoniphilus ovalis]